MPFYQAFLFVATLVNTIICLYVLGGIPNVKELGVTHASDIGIIKKQTHRKPSKNKDVRECGETVCNRSQQVDHSGELFQEP